jgi:hypothetical protein
LTFRMILLYVVGSVLLPEFLDHRFTSMTWLVLIFMVNGSCLRRPLRNLRGM